MYLTLSTITNYMLPFTCAITITLLKMILTVTNHPYKIIYDQITNFISIETVQNNVYT